MPSTDGAVVEVEKFCEQSAALSIVEQQDHVCPARNTVVFALTAHASLKPDGVCLRKKAGRIIGIAESVQTQPSRYQIRDPQNSEYIMLANRGLL
jgi:hypothetical protein